MYPLRVVHILTFYRFLLEMAGCDKIVGWCPLKGGGSKRAGAALVLVPM